MRSRPLDRALQVIVVAKKLRLTTIAIVNDYWNTIIEQFGNVRNNRQWSIIVHVQPAMLVFHYSCLVESTTSRSSLTTMPIMVLVQDMQRVFDERIIEKLFTGKGDLVHVRIPSRDIVRIGISSGPQNTPCERRKSRIR